MRAPGPVDDATPIARYSVVSSSIVPPSTASTRVAEPLDQAAEGAVAGAGLGDEALHAVGPGALGQLVHEDTADEAPVQVVDAVESSRCFRGSWRSTAGRHSVGRPRRLDDEQSATRATMPSCRTASLALGMPRGFRIPSSRSTAPSRASWDLSGSS